MIDISTKTLKVVGSYFRHVGLGRLIDHERRNKLNAFEPWMRESTISSGEASEFFSINHVGRRTRANKTQIETSRLKTLIALGFLDENEGELVQGRWRTTHHQGLFCVSDIDPVGSSNVYIGDDSLLFSEFVRSLPKSRLGLDMGSGSGISSVALAATCERVIGFDVVAECETAGRITAALNYCDDRVGFTTSSIEAYSPSTRFNVVIGNPPGVPVPPDITYSVAGNGGSDGLHLVRLFLSSATEWCQAEGTIAMRFQSVQDGDGITAYRLISALAKKYRWDVSLVTDIVVPIEVRSALTMSNAAKLNPHISLIDLASKIDKHMVNIGARSYTSTLMTINISGNGRVITQALHNRVTLDTRIFRSKCEFSLDTMVKQTYCAFLSLIGNAPGIFWVLGGLDEVAMVSRDRMRICSLLLASETPRQALDLIYPEALNSIEPRTRSIIIPYLIMAEAMLQTGLILER